MAKRASVCILREFASGSAFTAVRDWEIVTETVLFLTESVFVCAVWTRCMALKRYKSFFICFWLATSSVGRSSRSPFGV